MSKDSTLKSSLFTVLVVLLAIVIIEIVTQLTLIGVTFISSIVYAIFNSTLLSVVSIIVVIFIGGGALISAIIYMSKMTVETSPNKWLSISLGFIVALASIYLAVTTYVPANPTDNFVDIPVFVYDIPRILYGIATTVFSFFVKMVDEY